MYPIFTFGSEEQKILAPKLAKGERIGCFGLTNRISIEPRRDDNALQRKKQRLRFERRNMWITNGTFPTLPLCGKAEAEVKGFWWRGTKGFSAPNARQTFIESFVTPKWCFGWFYS